MMMISVPLGPVKDAHVLLQAQSVGAVILPEKVAV